MERRLFFGLATLALAVMALPLAGAGPVIAGIDVQRSGIAADLHHWHSGKGWLHVGTMSKNAGFDVGGIYRWPDGFYTLSEVGQPPVGVSAEQMAAMQPDNGAGQVSGDRAQSVGRAGDLKARRPDGVQSGGGNGARTVDARKTSWLTRRFLPVPS